MRLQAASSLLRGQSLTAAEFRRGSRRSSDDVQDQLRAKNRDEIKKTEVVRKKLRMHHEEARTMLAKKIQVENTRYDEGVVDVVWLW